MKKTNSIIILSIMLISCSYHNEPMHIQVSDQLMCSYRQETKSDGLQLIGSGGSFMHDVKGYDLHYVAIKNLSIDEVRRLYVKTMENLLYKINNDPQIRPFLHVYPFTLDQVKILIGFETPQGNFVDSRYIASVFHAKDKIVYRNYVNDKFCPVHEESYAEALQIVNGQQ